MKRMLDLMMTMMGKRMKSMMDLMMGDDGQKMKRMLDRMMMGRSMKTLCRVYSCQLIEMEVSDGEFATEAYQFAYIILKNS
jgi:hypothetical protein